MIGIAGLCPPHKMINIESMNYDFFQLRMLKAPKNSFIRYFIYFQIQVNFIFGINNLWVTVILFLVTKYAALIHRPSDLYTNTAISKVKKVKPMVSLTLYVRKGQDPFYNVIQI